MLVDIEKLSSVFDADNTVGVPADRLHILWRNGCVFPGLRVRVRTPLPAEARPGL